MITCRLKGGLGNMMFQIAAIESAGKVNGFETGYYNITENLHHLNTETINNPSLRHAHEYMQIFKNFDWKPQDGFKMIAPIQVPYVYPPTHRFMNWKIYEGFFQSEKWFYSEEFVHNLFRFSDYTKGQVSDLFRENDWPGEDSCFIHVRRGTRLTGPQKIRDIHPVTTIEYLKRAVESMGDKKYYVFSDDMEWCYDNVPTGTGTIYSTHKDYVDLYIMSMCRNAIIGPSSFSWWGAYLGIMDRVIAPDPWMLGERFNEKDVIPERWEKISL